MQALEWYSTIKEIAQRACALETQHKQMEREFRIAQDMSNLIIYCRSITFNLERAKQGFVFYEMSSFPENKADKLMCQLESKFFLKYHQVRIFGIFMRF